MWMCVVLFFSVTVLANSSNNDDYKIVTIEQGLVRGWMEPGGGVYAFYNIPYATAPTGINRYKAPLAPPVWTETFDAIDRGIACPQLESSTSITVEEDCLVVNVFTPDTSERNLPVLVNIHGGGYQAWYGTYYSFNELILTEKLVVVTFNYRLGVHGFLCLGTKDIPGNAGLKDQVALLRWVSTNIASFGGNPDDVTLIGCSAGAASIEYLTLSASTTGLYKRAIIESGAAFSILGPQIDPIANAKNYAKLFNITNVDNLVALEEFYKTATHEQLVSQLSGITESFNSVIPFAPCVERDVGEERVLEDAPINIIKAGKYNKVPLLYGFTNMDGLMRIDNFDTWKDKMNEKFSDFLSGELHFESEEVKEYVAETVKEFYFGNELVNEENILAYIDYFTDVLFAYPMLRALTARIESLGDTIYLFEYSFVDENTPRIPHTEERGAGHCDQTDIVRDRDKTKLSQEYLQMKGIMREYWLNFILTGSPSVQGSELIPWPPANANRTPHMSLGSTIELKSILLEKRAVLWDSIYEQYYKAPSPPVTGAGNSLMTSYILIANILINLYFVM